MAVGAGTFRECDERAGGQVGDRGAGEGGIGKKKSFFFEKKNQKTFAFLKVHRTNNVSVQANG
jgi:hypothetical protein